MLEESLGLKLCGRPCLLHLRFHDFKQLLEGLATIHQSNQIANIEAYGLSGLDKSFNRSIHRQSMRLVQTDDQNLEGVIGRGNSEHAANLVPEVELLQKKWAATVITRRCDDHHRKLKILHHGGHRGSQGNPL
jgi:hypothetical protein